jgi:hypothetical protein
MPEKYDDTNRGVLFNNDRKTKETQPDMTGKLNVDGVTKRLSVWAKTSKAGTQYWSVSVSDETTRPDQVVTVGPKDDIPW